MKTSGLVIFCGLAVGLVQAYPRPGLCGQFNMQPLYQWISLQYSGSADTSYPPNITYPTGVEEHGGLFYISTPRDLGSNPATLSTIPSNASVAGTSSPTLQPYPDISWHQLPSENISINCNKTLVSVHRTEADGCNRLWVLDSGNVDEPERPKRICPAKIVIFNLQTNEAERVIILPEDVVPPVSILTSIVLDNVIFSGGSWSSSWDLNGNSNSSNCDKTFAYMADIGTPGVVVYNHMSGEFYRITAPLMHPDPSYPFMQLNGKTFTCFYGVNEIAVSGIGRDRAMFTQPVSSLSIMSLSTAFLQSGPYRGDPSDVPIKKVAQKSSGGIGLETDPVSGCLLYNQISQNSINAYSPIFGTTRTVATSKDLGLVFDFTVNKQNIYQKYALSVGFMDYLRGTVRTKVVNIRIFSLTNSF